MDAFSAPADEKFAGLVAADNTEAVPLPVGEPLADPLSEDEQAQARAREEASHAPPETAVPRTGPPRAVELDPPSGPAARGPLTDRDLLSRIQMDQVAVEHKLVHIENALIVSRRANQIVMVTIGVACALLILSLYRRRSGEK